MGSSPKSPATRRARDEQDTLPGGPRPQEPTGGRPVLVALSGAMLGQVFAVENGANLVGRGPDAGICVHDICVSRRHALITYDPKSGHYELQDLGSANGTWLNGEQLDRVALLEMDDKIGVGGGAVLQLCEDTSHTVRFATDMYESARRDHLTGAYNRRYLEERLRAELSYAKRHSTDLTLLMIDFDGFKSVNDEHGHVTGDTVLVQLTQLLALCIRAEDVVVRYGGEEFAVICRGVDQDNGGLMAERLRQLIRAHPFHSASGDAISLSASIGVASAQESSAGSSEELIGAADGAMYVAKRAGRDRVAHHGQSEPA